MFVCSGFTGSSPGSSFGRTSWKERGKGRALMTRAPLRVRRRSGVYSGSGLTGRSASEPEPDDEEVPGSIRRGVQELPRRQEKDGRGGYSRRDVLPVSM